MHKLTCTCGSEKPYAQCCGPVIEGKQPAMSAEQLMRSRYTAYVLSNEDYLLQTWHPHTRPAQLGLTQEPDVRWLGLRILRTEAGGESDNEGEVEFVARYKFTSRAHRLHESSHFVKQSGRWFYLAGKMRH